MKTRKIVLMVLALMSSLAVSAAKGDEVWKSVKNWEDFCPHSEMGDLKGMVLYDVDADGISECFVVCEDGCACLACGDGTGKYGKEHIYVVANSINTTYLGIYTGQPYVAHQGGCGTGCVVDEYYKLEKSHLVAGYQSVVSYNPMSENEDDKEAEYMLLKPGQEPRQISSVLFEKNRPKNDDLLDPAEMELMPIASPARTTSAKIEPSKSSGETASATLHYQSADTTVIRDAKGYFYSVLKNGELAVAPGGAYAGDIVIPENVTYEGKSYKVTTVRREAFYKRPGASNIGTITSITLPSTVKLVGADAFRGNAMLSTLNCSKDTRIEVRSFWGCPKLKIERHRPVYAFTEPNDADEASADELAYELSTYYVPTENVDKTLASYQWAFHKYLHNGIRFTEWTNMENERAMACYSWNPDYIKAAKFNLIDKSNVETMFKGNMIPGRLVVLADNSYVATHEFPMFSRWMMGEKEKSAPEAFKQAMAKKYGRKVKYSYEVGKLLYTTNEQLVITEFAIANKSALYVLSWLKDGKEVCSYTCNRIVESEGDVSDVWNLGDDGNYGIPKLLIVARDEKGNIELFLYHGAEESFNFTHLVQKGDKLVQEGGEQWYNWIDVPTDEE